jgi:hypothetical protein
LSSRGEQRLGGLTRSRDPLAIIVAGVWLWLSAKQEQLRTVDPF